MEDVREFDWVGAQEGHWSVHGQPAATSGRGAVPHVRAHMNLQREERAREKEEEEEEGQSNERGKNR